MKPIRKASVALNGKGKRMESNYLAILKCMRDGLAASKKPVEQSTDSTVSITGDDTSVCGSQIEALDWAMETIYTLTKMAYKKRDEKKQRTKTFIENVIDDPDTLFHGVLAIGGFVILLAISVLIIAAASKLW